MNHRYTLTRMLVAEGVGTAFLLAAVVTPARLASNKKAALHGPPSRKWLKMNATAGSLRGRL